MKKIFYIIATIIFCFIGIYFYRNFWGVDKFNVPIDYSQLDNIRIDYKFKSKIFEIDSSNYKVIDLTKKVPLGSQNDINEFFETGNVKNFDHTIESFTLYLFIELRLNNIQQYNNCRKNGFYTIIVDVENKKTKLFCKSHQGDNISQDIILMGNGKEVALYKVILENYFKSIKNSR